MSADTLCDGVPLAGMALVCILPVDIASVDTEADKDEALVEPEKALADTELVVAGTKKAFVVMELTIVLADAESEVAGTETELSGRELALADTQTEFADLAEALVDSDDDVLGNTEIFFEVIVKLTNAELDESVAVCEWFNVLTSPDKLLPE